MSTQLEQPETPETEVPQTPVQAPSFNSAKIHEDLAKIAKKLMFKEPFYGLFLISLNKDLTMEIPTACVSKNGINVQLSVNPEFWMKQDDMTKIAIFKHELLHVALNHLGLMSSFYDKKLLNMAADLEINQYIQDEYKGPTWDGLEINKKPFDALKLPEKAGTREYYKLLQQEAEQNPNGDVGKMLQALKDQEGGQSITVTLGDGTEISVPCTHDFWKEFENLSEAEQKLIQKQIEHQLKETAESVQRSRGTIPSELSSIIGALFEIEEPVIDWKSYIRRFNGMANKVYTKKTRRKPNRRFGDGPALKIKNKKNTLVAIDTSGSVSNADLLEFFNEIHHIHKTGTQIDIIECDAAVQRVYAYDGKKGEQISVKGRGGTDFEPVMQYLNEHGRKYQNLIYLTDGECCAPQTNPKKPVLWVLCSGVRINNDLPGQVIQITR